MKLHPRLRSATIWISSTTATATGLWTGAISTVQAVCWAPGSSRFSWPAIAGKSGIRWRHLCSAACMQGAGSLPLYCLQVQMSGTW